MVATVRPALALRRQLARLFLVGAVPLVATVVAGTFAYVNLLQNRHDVISRIDPANVSAAQMLTAYVDEETGVRGYVLTHQSLFLQPYQEGQAAALAADQALTKVLPSRSRAGLLLEQVHQTASLWETNFAQPAIKAVASGDQSFASTQALDESKSEFDQVRSAFAALQHDLSSERSKAISHLSTASDELAGVLIFALIVLIGLAVLVWRSLRGLVVEPLTLVGEDARLVTSGDLAHPVSPVGPAEIWQLATDIEAMRGRILQEVATVREAQEQLADANSDLIRSNLELEQFAYVASHDLQEPLRKVTSFCQLLQDRYAGQMDERADQYINLAVDGAKRMQNLINDLLAFSRIGRTADQFVPVTLEECTAAAIGNLATAIEESGAIIEVAGSLPIVIGDRGLLTSLLQNLIGNAIKFRSAERPVVRLDAVWSDEGWLLELSDNGIGIEPRFAERIFVIFQRLHGREVYGGTGIGLAMCRKIVEFHGGRIWLDTDHSPGTRFRFTLPAIVKQEDADELDRPVHAG